MSEPNPKLHLQTVIIKKEGLSFEAARKLSQSIIQNSKKRFFREKAETYHFRNIPKTEFKPGTFVSKKVNDQITLVFGQLQ